MINNARKNTYQRTSEHVASGHPDKVADYIADSVFDYLRNFKKDPQSAVEVIVSANKLVVFGEIDADVVYNEIANENIDRNERSVSKINPRLAENIAKIALNAIRELGYDKKLYNPEVIVDLVVQSMEINNAVENKAGNTAIEASAGDQGIVMGFATNETPNYHELHYILPVKIMKELEQDRRDGRIKWLLPDAKAQVTVAYEKTGDGKLDKIVSIDNILLSQSHLPTVDFAEVKEVLKDRIKEISKNYLNSAGIDQNVLNNTEFLINPAGSWSTPGPAYDSGLCLEENTLISTDNGLVKIKDINIGDIVVTETGNANVVEKIDNGVKPTLLITDQNNISIEATYNHPFRVLDENGEIVWREAGGLSLGSYLIRKATDSFDAETLSDLKKEVLNHLKENNLQITKIKEITESKGQTWDISLDDHTHSFVGNGFIVHNTGRKLVTDNYGSAYKIGGGASSGKNSSKVDRSGAYYARNIAKSIIYSGLADKVAVELGFAIGVPDCISINIDTFGTEKIDIGKIKELVNSNYCFKVQEMKDLMDSATAFKEVAKHGSYTNLDFPWEQPILLK